MSRKDYQLIAAVFKERMDAHLDALDDLKAHRDLYGEEHLAEQAVRDTIEVIASNLATSLQFDNPAFDRERFLKACGL